MGRFLVAAVVLVVYLSVSYAYRYVGCYEDKGLRILNGKVTSGDMTIEKCVQSCSRDGTNFAGVEFANQCFCGKRMRKYKRLADSACSTNCGGNSNQKCGGTWKISVYATNKYVGCFVDTASRILYDGPNTSSNKMTTEVCIKFCKNAGKKFALTQYASQCFCGDNLDSYQQKDDSECNYNCSGASSEKCGGFWRGSLYVVP